MQKFFRRFDSDQDGTISIPEFRAGLGMMGIRMDGTCVCVCVCVCVSVSESERE